MIYFFADDHYDAHPGRVIFEHLPEELKSKTAFYENEWDVLEHGDWDRDCELMILNMIGATCGQPHPGAEAEKRVRRYLERGGSALLLHGSSAAFWMWDWWRPLVGERWVRPNDPDGTPASTHPKKPCFVKRSVTRHALARKLREMDLPEDEIYTNLENTCPCMRLMETHITENPDEDLRILIFPVENVTQSSSSNYGTSDATTTAINNYMAPSGVKVKKDDESMTFVLTTSIYNE